MTKKINVLDLKLLFCNIFAFMSLFSKFWFKISVLWQSFPFSIAVFSPIPLFFVKLQYAAFIFCNLTIFFFTFLGNFEESVLNGRLEPNSTVEGFTAEIGASGSFQPKHKTLPVTVFFYTLCDNAAYSSPYLGMYSINLCPIFL